MISFIINRLSEISFYQEILENLGNNPIAAVLLTALESFIPPLPLIGIVTFNIAVYGPFLGFLLSWIGTSVGCTLVFLLIRHVIRRPVEYIMRNHEKVQKGKEWVQSISISTLFVVTIFPFTPSAFLNLVFGLSDYNAGKYLCTIIAAKLLMIGFLALFGASFVQAFENPVMILLSLALVVILYILSKIISKNNGLN
ncbi:Uncharacterized membrane protein YdjX, TVP38/TMEM64 family, SNARE-associated domain [Lachnospiraceae bacterium]|nr:Uncharacterized membrane protein YdjX, TVP38/TMEM64 family, SNARE-associated domain [Lachnospiraceae bacterium]